MLGLVTLKRINVMLAPRQWKWLQREARAQGMSASALLRIILDRARETA